MDWSRHPPCEVVHIRDAGRHRDEYEVRVGGALFGTVVVPDDVIITYPNDASLRCAVDRSIASMIEHRNLRGLQWLPTWFPGMGVT